MIIIDTMKLVVEGTEYDLIEFDLSVAQGTDKGKVLPSGKAKVRHFKVHYRSNGNRTIHKALNDTTMALEGSINFMAAGALVDQIVFAKPTFCVGHRIIGKAPDPSNDSDSSSSITEEAMFLLQAENISWEEVNDA